MMWGYRQADTTTGDLDDVGSAMVCHYNVNNLIVSNNLFYDSARALTVGGAVNGFAMRNAEFSENIIYGIKTVSMKIYESDNVTLHDNLNKETGLDFQPGVYSNWLTFIDCTDMVVEENLSVNTYDNNGVRIDNSTVFPLNNGYYNSSPGQMQDPSDIYYTTDPTAAFYDLIFTTHRFTNNPLSMSIPKVLSDDPSGMFAIGSHDNQWKVYPNPVKDKLYLKADVSFESLTSLSLYDITGQLVKQQVFPAGNKLLVMELKGLKPGLYVLKVISENRILERKIVIIE